MTNSLSSPEVVRLRELLGARLRSSSLYPTFVSTISACHFLMAGGSVYDLQRNLGHHAVSFTAVYGHLSQDHRVKESDRLAGLFQAPEPAKVLPFSQAAAK